jgi:hypothetical protein
MRALALGLMAILSLAGCVEAEPVATVTATTTVTAEPTQEETAAATQEPEVEVLTLTLPDVVGDNASDAIDEIISLGFTEANLQDASDEERIVLVRSNWFICSMKPEAGSTLDTDQVVVLLSVKNSESCPDSSSAQPSPEPEASVSATPTPSPSPTATEQQLTTGQRNAVRKAESYLSFMAFSRTGLIEQLEFEGFSRGDSTFAVDHLSINWKKQAVEKAASYLDLMAFSRQGLIDQLLFEGFTQSEAEYGVSQNGY